MSTVDHEISIPESGLPPVSPWMLHKLLEYQKKYPEVLVAVQHEGFYLFFGKDAHLASRALGRKCMLLDTPEGKLTVTGFLAQEKDKHIALLSGSRMPITLIQNERSAPQELWKTSAGQLEQRETEEQKKEIAPDKAKQPLGKKDTFPPLPIGAVIEIPEFQGHDTQRFRIDAVDPATGTVSLSDVTPGHSHATTKESVGAGAEKIEMDENGLGGMKIQYPQDYVRASISSARRTDEWQSEAHKKEIEAANDNIPEQYEEEEEALRYGLVRFKGFC